MPVRGVVRVIGVVRMIGAPDRMSAQQGAYRPDKRARAEQYDQQSGYER